MTGMLRLHFTLFHLLPRFADKLVIVRTKLDNSRSSRSTCCCCSHMNPSP